ncbi:MAG: QacE family quaternary ammonium compound efflux SMR transporter [Oceanospirillaceae bacterium]|uniref:DMT family transporter n=1 Tax=unclassified Thalassolituus TaxID=2624967 RepID=UPI000C098329|nr:MULTISPECIES: SMR family transporter [unclassified Thalassolituus]MAK92350.1 QacE family quaternary ammonium compound efflux SMR transporter [Thalassolituus sp.]MAS26632.1 QacE family quaternary ammonium compound efflux SMR transporter [Oceanospirillaceae bacterium]MAY00005.1 QacE family quaternary ammonium compound efflux SMR transporter [Oceanospirillaceae bacterium]MBS51551.1 QacE family quaternary ammonium compound efflux SMR transporter [Oceanospirillaceae bacterium]|tara:strand:+ start:714 stop:1046 length:333 start_codon:yes stop_codon:yes gene_type:complete
MQTYLLLLVAIAAEVTATSALKLSEGFTRLWPSVIVIVFYCASLYLLSIVLKTIPVGISYAIWAGLGIVCVTLIGWFFYDQALDWPAILGMALIVAGVLVINLFSSVGHG